MSIVGSTLLYLGTYISSALCLAHSKKVHKQRIDLFFILAVVLPVVLAAFRYNVGTDYNSYIYIYEHNSQLSFREWYVGSRNFDGTRIGVWAVSRICGFFNSPILFFGMFACIVYLPVAYVIKKSYCYSLAFILTFAFLTLSFSSGLNAMKQMASVSILFLGYKSIYQRRFFKYIFIVLLASCFHITAIVGVALYFLYGFNLSRIGLKSGIIFVSLMLLYILSPVWLSFVGGRFEAYLDYTGDINNRSFYINLVWEIIFIIFLNRYALLSKENIFLNNALLVGLIVSLTGFISPFIKRIAIYFRFPEFIMISQMPYVIHGNKKFLREIIFAYYIFMFILTYCILGQANIIPFNFIAL